MALKSALLDEVVEVCRRKGYSLKTAKTYRHWAEVFLLWAKATYGQWRHPRDMGREELTQWLTELATVRNVSPTSQNVALQAMLFVYRELLDTHITGVDALRAKRPKRLPTVLAPIEVAQLLGQLTGQSRLIGSLLYGCGLRIGECLSLRIKDVDLYQRQLIIRAGKGAKDRAVGLPRATVEPLRRQIEVVSKWHAADVKAGCNRVEMPYAYSRKSPAAAGSLGWYWLFCSHQLSRHPTENWYGRYHIDESNVGRSLSVAARRAGIVRRVNPHCLRHSYATHTLNGGTDIRTLQQLLGHADVRTTMIYTHVEACGVTAETSPLDRLPDVA